MIIKGQLIDIHNREVFPASVEISGDRINSIERLQSAPDCFIMPGLIDAHIHIESSMLTPGAFAVAAVSKGSIGVVSDPHEIANVMGMEGVRYMIGDGKKVPFKFWFGAPSCVPATIFETSGAKISVSEIKELLKDPEIVYLSEMMNYPGVINNDAEVLQKIEIAKSFSKPVDGHAPGLKGTDLIKYVNAGITTDHECSNLSEALEKIDLGMKILIREGSAARNLDALQELFNLRPGMIMLCSDDIHPEMLVQRHINKIISRLVERGFDLFNVIRAATVNPVNHYKLNAGLLREGDPADIIIVDNVRNMDVLETWVNGKKVYERGKVLFKYNGSENVNNFNCSTVEMDDLVVKKAGDKIRVIKASDGELITEELIIDSGSNRYIETNTETDILKIVVKDRYKDGTPTVGYIKGFGLKSGAFASSIAHDSHNIIAVGVNDFEIIAAVNEVIRCRGGLAVTDGDNIDSMQLKIGGIMSDLKCKDVADGYQYLSDRVEALGCNLKAPFMTLSFMALLVIPELKISDKGLFSVIDFKTTSLFV
jgi:adenine deaminase